MTVESMISDVSNRIGRFTLQATEPPSLGDFVFFQMVLESLDKRIDRFGTEILGNMALVAGSAALGLMTLWLLIQGYRIVTGQSRDSMAALMTNMARAALIVTLSTSLAMYGKDFKEILSKKLPSVISFVVTGKDKLPEAQIDSALGWMQVAFAAIDAIQVIDDPALRGEVAKSQLLVGLGTGGPAVVAGSMMLLYKVALALFVGLGPLFILCLLFDQTKALFQKWLLYGIGTMFSMAVMTMMVSIALDMVVRVAGVFWVREMFDGGASISSLAMQTGGMGLILTTLIITAPPMAAMFFQGTLGSFMAYSQIGGSPVAQPGPQGQPAGAYAPPQTGNGSSALPPQAATPQFERGMGVAAGESSQRVTGRLGHANR